MFASHHLAPWLEALATASAAIWSFTVRAAPSGRRPTLLREEDMTDWLLADIGLKDGRDTAARRAAARSMRPLRTVL